MRQIISFKKCTDSVVMIERRFIRGLVFIIFALSLQLREPIDENHANTLKIVYLRPFQVGDFYIRHATKQSNNPS